MKYTSWLHRCDSVIGPFVPFIVPGVTALGPDTALQGFLSEFIISMDHGVFHDDRSGGN